MDSLKTGILSVLLALLSGCSDPLAQDKLHYAGEWQSKEMYLLILEDGSVAYKRLKKGVTTSINGPLKEFQGDNFVVGVGPVTTVFIVSKPPHQVAGQWKMVVDGVLLTKSMVLVETNTISQATRDQGGISVLLRTE